MLKKGLEVVQLVALRGELSVRELAAAMNLPKSTAHRLVASLVSVRLLQATRKDEGDAYTVGPLVGELSGASFAWRRLVQHARDPLTAVRDDTGETAGIHMLYGHRRVLLDQVVSQHQHRWVYANHMVPMQLRAGATGKMFMAILDADELNEVLKNEWPDAAPGSKPEKDLAKLKTRIDEVRKRNCSVSADEINPGITSIAVPVISSATNAVPRTVISLAAPSVRVTEQICAKHIQRLKKAAADIAHRIAADT